jgi:hypothetical protein
MQRWKDSFTSKSGEADLNERRFLANAQTCVVATKQFLEARNALRVMIEMSGKVNVSVE